jgi:hypothetical protein
MLQVKKKSTEKYPSQYHNKAASRCQAMPPV